MIVINNQVQVLPHVKLLTFVTFYIFVYYYFVCYFYVFKKVSNYHPLCNNKNVHCQLLV